MTDTTPAFDREAQFERIVLPLRHRMMRTVWRVVRDPDLAEDAFQEALVTAWRKLPAVARHPNPQALLLRIALQAALDQLRARERRRRWATPLEPEAVSPGGDSPARPAEQAELSGVVATALARLKTREATALLARVVEGESYGTIAQALGCSEPTARVHVSRARGKLRQWLAHLRPASRVRGGR